MWITNGMKLNPHLNNSGMLCQKQVSMSRDNLLHHPVSERCNYLSLALIPAYGSTLMCKCRLPIYYFTYVTNKTCWVKLLHTYVMAFGQNTLIHDQLAANFQTIVSNACPWSKHFDFFSNVPYIYIYIYSDLAIRQLWDRYNDVVWALRCLKSQINRLLFQ